MPEAEPLRPGDPGHIGPFRLMGRLGEGGQGVVFKGLAEGGEPVAVKLLHTRFTGNPRARGAFAYELAAAQKVDPFCTARILAADVEGDIPYIASEYIDGLSLKRTVAEWGPRAGSQLNRLAIGTATALVAIHKAGVVHRDFKPSNVLLGPDGPRVIDFGVARALDLTTSTLSSGGPVGTPAYMAPEQFARAPVNTAVDVFAWASTLVYASCGQPPFGNDSISGVINRILHDQPDFGALDGGLLQLAAACLQKDPAARPSADQLLLDLIGSGASAYASGRYPVQPPARDSRRRGRGARSAPDPGQGQAPGLPPGSPGLPAGPAPMREDDPLTGPGRPYAPESPRVQPSAGDPETSRGRGQAFAQEGLGDPGRDAESTRGRGQSDGPGRPAGNRGSRGSRGKRRQRGADPETSRGPGSSFDDDQSLGTGTFPAVSRLELRKMQRDRRRQATTRNGRLAGAAGLLVVVGLVAFLMWPSDDEDEKGGDKTVVSAGTVSSSAAPRAGRPLSLSNTLRRTYSMAAVSAGFEDKGGLKYPYIDYILTNTAAQPEPVETVGDLFVRKHLVTDTKQPCMPQAGADGEFCSVRNHTEIKAYLDGSKPPVEIDGEQSLTGGASYLLRVRGDMPVDADLDPAKDLQLYVWDTRFFRDRVARIVPLP